MCGEQTDIAFLLWCDCELFLLSIATWYSPVCKDYKSFLDVWLQNSVCDSSTSPVSVWRNKLSWYLELGRTNAHTIVYHVSISQKNIGQGSASKHTFQFWAVGHDYLNHNITFHSMNILKTVSISGQQEVPTSIDFFHRVASAVDNCFCYSLPKYATYLYQTALLLSKSHFQLTLWSWSLSK
jgi:hypothetical protein